MNDTVPSKDCAPKDDAIGDLLADFVVGMFSAGALLLAAAVAPKDEGAPPSLT